MKENFLYQFVRKYRIKKPLFIGYCVALSIIFYFGFFTFFGDKGLVQLFTLKKQITNKEITKQEIFARMQAKKNMVYGMNLESLDLDLLDEQARKVLGYAGKNEVVIYREKNPEKTDLQIKK
jgi:cell division protein FtsB